MKADEIAKALSREPHLTVEVVTARTRKVGVWLVVDLRSGYRFVEIVGPEVTVSASPSKAGYRPAR